MFGQIRILTRSFQLPYIVSVWCAVLDDQMIGPFIFEVSLRRVPSNCAGRISPTFGRCACE